MAPSNGYTAAVDELTIDVIVDNRTDALSSAPSMVTSEFSKVLGRRAGSLTGRCLCCAGHGLSLLLTAVANGQTVQVLFDAGPDPELFERNASVLGLDLSGVSDVVLSHGHWDHAAGLTSALRNICRTRNGACRIHLNDGMFVRRGVRMAGERILSFESIPDEAEMRATGALPVIDRSERTIGGGLFYLSGEIARTTAFENGFAGHVGWDEAGMQWVDDPLIMDERYLAVRIRERGIIVFSACSHAGAVNVMHDARRRFASDRLFGLVGGLHLSGLAMEAKITQTVDALAGFNLSVIVPAHCSGWRAIGALAARFGEEATIPCAVGQTLRF